VKHFALSAWWSVRPVFLRRGTVYRAECAGCASVDFATPGEASRYVATQNAHNLSRRVNAPLINFPL